MRLRKNFLSSDLGFLHEAGFDRLNAHPHSLYLSGGEAHLDALQVGAELALGTLGYVRADATTLLALSLTVDDTARGGTLTCNCANSSHVGN